MKNGIKEFQFEKILNKHLNSEEPWDTTKSFYMSDMGKCLRMRWLKRKGFECEPFSNRLKRIFSIGKLGHLYLQEMLEKQGVLIGAEIPVQWQEYELHGRVDALVNIEKYLVYDFKFTHSRKILIKKYDTDDLHYIKQVLTYVKRLQKEYPDLKEARLVYVSRDDWLIKEVSYELTPEWDKEIEEEMQALWGYWTANDMPPELSSDDQMIWQCRFCNYKQHCPNKLKGGKK